MHGIRVAIVLFVALALSGVPAFADVTIKMTMSTIGGPVAMEMTTTTYIKGQKARHDAKGMNQDVSMVVDVAAGEQLLIDHVARQAAPFNPQAAAAGMPMSFGDATMSLKPSGQTREILGRTCAGYLFQMSIPMTIANETVTMTMSGPVWIASQGAGVADFRAFYKAALASGLFVTSPLAQGPQGKSMAEMQKAFAEQGIPLEQEIQMTIEGSGQMAQMMRQMNMAMKTTATAISTDTIPDETFAVPAGYTRK